MGTAFFLLQSNFDTALEIIGQQQFAETLGPIGIHALADQQRRNLLPKLDRLVKTR